MSEDTYDYEGMGFLKPITIDVVRESIKEELSNFEGVDVTTEKAKAAIEKLAKEKMFSLWQHVDYMSEDSELEDLAEELYEE